MHFPIPSKSAQRNPFRKQNRRPLIEPLETRITFAAGDLDPGFGGGDGVVVIDHLAKQLIESGEAVAVQADGKILIAGSATDGFGRFFPDLLLVRLNADGSRDLSFGTEGQVTFDFGGSYLSREEAFAVAVQADGKIVVAGRAALASSDAAPLDYDFALARFNTDGSVDTGFGTGGFVRTDLGGAGDAARGLAITPGGLIYAVGETGGDAAVVRYTAAGALDTTFATTGKVVRDLGGADTLRAAVVQGDGKLVAAGTTTADFAALRFTTTGDLDAGFGNAGVARVDFGSTGEEARAVALDATGRIVLGGGVRVGAVSDFGLARLTTAGVLDATFGTGGKVTFNAALDPASSALERIEGLAVQGDGKIIVAGTAAGAFNRTQWHAARVDENGALDGSFGTGGIARLALDVSTFGKVGGVALTGGQLVIAGTRQSDDPLQPYSLGAMKLTTGGALDPAFDSDGVALFDARGPADNSPTASTVLSDGSVLVAENVRVTPTNSLAGSVITVTHLLPDGSPDVAFGENGTVTIDLGRSASEARAIIRLDDGKILLAGARYFLPAAGAVLTNEAVLARLNADGTLDTSFGTDGIVTDRLLGATYALNTTFVDAAVQSDGKIVVLTNGVIGNLNTTIAVSRYLADGTLDPSFAGDGRAELSVTSKGSGLTDLKLLSDGRLLLAGTDEEGSIMLVRLNADGTPDAAFGDSGVKTFDLQGAFGGVVVEGDGTLRIGVSLLKNNVYTPTVLGLTADGAFLGSFGVAGVLTSDIRTAESPDAFAEDAEGRFLFAVRVGDGTGQRVDAIARFGADGLADPHFGTYAGAVYTDAHLAGISLLAPRPDGSLLVIGGTTSPSDAYVARFLGDPVAPAEGLLSFDLRYSGARESSGLAVIDVTRLGGSTGTVTVDYAITGGTATPGDDYTSVSGTLTFAPGETTQQIQIPLTVDLIGELAETIELTLTNATGGAVLQNPAKHEVLIFAHNGGLGSVDPNFGVNGLATANHSVPPGSADLVKVTDRTFTADGKILVVGQGGYNTVGGAATGGSEADGGVDFLIARFNADGTPDTSFGDNGKVSTDFGFNLDFAQSVGVLADGRFIVAGYTFLSRGDTTHYGEGTSGFGGGPELYAFARFNADGTLDRTYGNNGLVTFDPRSLPGRTGVATESVFQDFVVLPTGEIVAGVALRDYSADLAVPSTAAAALVRFDAQGNLDTTFGGGDGFAESGLSSSVNSGLTLARQADGKFILAVGSGDYHGPQEERTALARFNADGTLDPSFGTKGTVTFDLFLGDESSEIPRSIAFQQDGKILLAGKINTDGDDGLSEADPTARDERGYVARLNANGTLDTTFSTDGVAFYAGLSPRTSPTVGGTEGDITDVAQLANGRIVATGTSTVGAGIAFVTLEFLADGTPDPAFGINGAFRHTALTESSGRTNGAVLVTPANEIISIFGARLASGGASPGDSLFALQRISTQGSAGAFEWTLAASSVEETDGAVSLLVRRVGGTDGVVSVDYSFASGTATLGADFIGINGTIHFDDGQALAEVIVPITRGDAVEPTETFTVTLANPTGGTALGAVATQTVSILDGPDRFEFASPTFGFLEGSRFVSVQVVRKGAEMTAASVDYTLRGIEAVNGVDFDAAEGGTVYFAAGQTTALITFALRADDLPEGRESLALTLARPQGGPGLGAVTEAVVNIFDTQPGKGSNAGALDPSFAGDGSVNLDVFGAGTGEQSRDVVVQADGKIVVVGESGGNASDFLIARYLPDGTLDASFGTGGVVTTDFFGSADSARAVALDAAGRIVVAGWALREGRADFAVARYLANGTLDPSFDTDGRATVDFDGFDDRATSLAIGADGRIVLGGVTSGVQKSDFAAAVLTSAGALDTTFSGDGRVTLDFSNRMDVANAVLVQPDGSIVLGGTSSLNSNIRGSNFALARLTAAGALDTTFSGDGKLLVLQTVGNYLNTALNALALRPDGSLLFAGGLDANIVFGQVTAAGRPVFYTTDNFTSGSGGVSSVEAITDLALAADGSFIAAGYTIFPGESQQRLFVKRVLPDFTYDTSFGLQSTSVVTTLDGARGVAFTPEGGIVTTGGAFEVARLLQASSAPPQGSFFLGALSYSVAETAGSLLVQVRRPLGNSEGVVTVDYGVVGITAQAGQDFTPVAGTLTFRESETVKTFSIPIINDALKEYNEVFGIVLTNPTGGAELSSAAYAQVVIPANDLTTGTTPGGFAVSTPGFGDFVVEGFALVTVTRSGGSLGAVTVDYHTEDGTAKAGEDYTAAFGTLTFANGETSKQIFLNTTADDRIEGPETFYLKFTSPTGGSTLDPGFDTMTLTISDTVPSETFPYAGVLDVSFDTDGRAMTDSGVAGADNFFAVAQQPDGKLVAVGQAGTSGGFFLARYNADGSPDTSFGTEGKTVTSLDSAYEELALAVRVQPDGKLLVLGVSGADGTHDELVLARYTAAGVLDKSFGTKGFTRTPLQPALAEALFFKQGNGDVALQADGKFVVTTMVRNGFDNDLALLRFLPTGQLDTSFGTGGTLTYDLGFSDDSATSVSVQPDGKIVVAFASGEARAVRFNADGSVDTAFGTGGVARANPAALLLSPGLVYNDTALIYESLVLPDGDILLLGTAYGSAKPADSSLNFTESLSGGVLLLRFNADGTLDPGFGTGGAKDVRGTSLSTISDAVLDPAGKLILASTSGLARLFLDGRADPGFGPNGIASSGTGSDVLVQADGRLVVTGGSAFATGDARVSRFLDGPAAGALRLNVLTEHISEDGGMLVIPVERIAGLDGAVSVTFSTVDGTATAGSDYGAVTQVLSWADREDGVKTVSIPITDDLLADANETFTFMLSAPTGGAVLSVRKTGTVTIADDDQPGVLEFAQPAFLAHENDGTATLTVRRHDGDLGAVSVNYSVTGGTAVSGVDFTLAAGTLNFADGEREKTITVSLLDDATLGEDKTVVVTLADPAGGALLGTVPAARLTILDDEVPLGGIFGFGSARLETREDGGGYLVTVLRTGGSAGAATVNLNVAPGTALSGRDFIPFATTLNFADGQTSASAFIPILDNATVNPDRTVLLSLDTPTGDLVLSTRTQPAIGSDGMATLTITDNDAFPARISPGTLVLFAGNASESHAAPIVLYRTDGSAGAVSVKVMLTSGTATAGEDFIDTPILVNFAAGELSKTVFVPVRNDLLHESAETFHVALTDPTGGVALGVTTAGTVTITDDDASALPDIDGDGDPDLVLLKGGKFYIHLNPGDGNYPVINPKLNPADAAKIVATVKGAKSFVFGDFDGDGNDDLAVLGAKKMIYILRGNDDGTLSAPVSFLSGPLIPGKTTTRLPITKGLVVGDFNRDGRPDLAGITAKGINVLLNTSTEGAPNFAPAVQAAAGTGFNALFAADFNEDGRLDLAALKGGAKPTVNIFEGAGTGRFAPLPVISKVPKSMKATQVTDVNGDGHLDFVAIFPKNNLGFVAGAGTSVYGLPFTSKIVPIPTLLLPTEKGPVAFGIGDFDDDLDLDLLAINAKKLATVLVNGNPDFARQAPSATLFKPTGIAVADVNGDDDPDLVLFDKRDGFRVILGGTGPTFATPTP